MKYEARARDPEAVSCTYARDLWLSSGSLICSVQTEGRARSVQALQALALGSTKGDVVPDFKASQAE